MQFIFNSVLTIVIIFLIIGLLVFIHELGHFLVAKKLGIVVQEFAFGFGPKIFARKWRGTLYRFNLLPFGGYVKMLGDLDGSSFLRYEAKDLKPSERTFVFHLFSQNNIDPRRDNYDKISDFYEAQKQKLTDKELRKLDNYMAFEYIPKHPGNLDNHRILHRAAVLIAGVIMNILLGAVLFYIFFLVHGFYVDFLKLGNPQFLLAEASAPPILYKVYDPNVSDFTGGVVTSINDQILYTAEQTREILNETYNQRVKVKYFANSLGYLEQSLILNGDGFKSNLDEDLQDKILITEVVQGSAAEQAGLESGEYIISFADHEISQVGDLRSLIRENQGNPVAIKVLSLEGNLKIVTANLPKVDNNQPVLGISFINVNDYAQEFLRISYENSKLLSGTVHSLNMIYYTVVAGGELIEQSIQQRSLGPVSQGVNSLIVLPDFVYSLVKINDFASIINLAGLVSVSLAFMNILPIPLLDGGQLLFLLIEKKRGKPLSIKAQQKIGQITFIILIILTVVIMAKDIFQFDFPTRILNLIQRLFNGGS